MQKRLVTAVIATILAPALLLAQKVSYDFNKSTNFAALKSYVQKPGTKVGQELIDARIADAIALNRAPVDRIEILDSRRLRCRPVRPGGR